TIETPNDDTVPVIELWYIHQGQAVEPDVAIFPGGKVRAKVGQGELWGEISQQEVQALLNDLLVNDDLFRLQTEDVQRDLNRASSQTGLSHKIEQADDTIIRIRTAEKMYRVDAPAVGLLATRFPDCPGIQKMFSAQGRLENVKAVIMVG